MEQLSTASCQREQSVNQTLLIVVAKLSGKDRMNPIPNKP